MCAIPMSRAQLDERLISLLNDWQTRAKLEEKPIPWRWLLTSRFLNLALGLGKLNGIIAQVRCSSDFLWECEDFATAVVQVSLFLYGLFGEHIGDFTRWKHHDDYQQAFERLLRDLKAET